jgi:hypothetical protein
MNERIRELADEAKMSTYLLAYGLEFNISIEKFAELIVKECLAQADTLRDSFESEGEDQQSLGAGWAGLAIARHFGVKE